jgi:hypothetical protein
MQNGVAVVRMLPENTRREICRQSQDLGGQLRARARIIDVSGGCSARTKPSVRRPKGRRGKGGDAAAARGGDENRQL